jgi:hypothetical protein
MRSELQNGVNLLVRHAKFFNQFIHAHVFDVLEHGRNGRPGAFKHPCAAPFAGNAFHGGALGPIEVGHVSYSLSSLLFSTVLLFHARSFCESALR